jgi:hypothetical protein
VANTKPASREMKDVPVLTGWLSLPVAGERLGRTRQRAYQLVQENVLKTARQIPGVGERPAAYIVRETEVSNLVARERAARSCPQCAELRDAGSPQEFCPHTDVPEIVADEPSAVPA